MCSEIIVIFFLKSIWLFIHPKIYKIAPSFTQFVNQFLSSFCTFLDIENVNNIHSDNLLNKKCKHEIWQKTIQHTLKKIIKHYGTDDQITINNKSYTHISKLYIFMQIKLFHIYLTPLPPITIKLPIKKTKKNYSNILLLSANIK